MHSSLSNIGRDVAVDNEPMRAQRSLAVLFAATLFAAGCSTQEAKQGTAVMASAAGMVAGMPLMTFTIPYAAIRDANENRTDEALYKQLDPVYQKRIEMIKARSPKADAEAAWNEKTIAFLGGDFHYDLRDTEFSKTGEENRKQIAASDFLTNLQALLNDDPLQKQVHIWNDQYLKFKRAAWAYEKEFNLEMYQKIKTSKLTDTNHSFESRSP
jgi:hypothetical protein